MHFLEKNLGKTPDHRGVKQAAAECPIASKRYSDHAILDGRVKVRSETKPGILPNYRLTVAPPLPMFTKTLTKSLPTTITY